MKNNSMPWTQYDIKFAEFVASIIKNKIITDYLKEQISHDFLTGLLNRQSLDKILATEISRAHRGSTALSVLMLDIDHFKQVNDTYGHTAGDTLLVALANFLKSNFRPYDNIFRFGGEEFLIIMSNMHVNEAQKKAIEIQSRMKGEFLKFQSHTIPFPTLSIGISEYPLHSRDMEILITLADHALYQAKIKGRDRVELAK